MVENAGAAIQFVILLVIVTVFGAYVLLQSAYVFVNIAQQTADGRDEVDWPKEFWFDRIGRALHLVWLVAFWLVPLGFLLRVIGPLPPTATASLRVGVPAGLFWLLFPMTLLSSFSASSPWVLFRWEALSRMARRPGATFGFYLATAPLCLLGGAALYLTLDQRIFYALPVLGTVVFLYGRLVGRYSRLLGEVRFKGANQVDKEVRRAARAAEVEDPWGAPPEGKKKERPRKKKKKRAAQVEDPWAVPEEEASDAESAGPAVKGYGIAEDEPAPARKDEPKRPRVKGYKVSAEEPPPRPKEVPLDGSEPVELKTTLAEREKPLPDRPLLEGVYTFPWYRSNLGMWGLITFLLLVWGFLYVTMQEGRPF